MSPSQPPRLAAIGECMIELRHKTEESVGLAYGGDTLNTAVYAARLGGSRFSVSYATALGDDPYSEAMLAFWRSEGLDTALVARLPGRLPGLYAIRTDSRGERSFYYWRRDAAARRMFDDPPGETLAARLAEFDWLYLSGITLSILEPPARRRLIGALDHARRSGARIAFDGNYRSRGWDGPAAARAAFEEVLQRIDLALPSFEDEAAVFGDTDPLACARRLRAGGIAEIAVKNGDRPVILATGDGEAEIPTIAVARATDTTAAGDAFNGGYLAARMLGRSPLEACGIAHRLAAVVIQHPGAIIPRHAMPADLLSVS